MSRNFDAPVLLSSNAAPLIAKVAHALPSVFDYQNYREFIKAHLDVRTAKNSSYSLRAMARSVGMSAPHLSQVFSGKRNLSQRRAQIIAAHLKMTKAETEYLEFIVKNDPGPQRPAGGTFASALLHVARKRTEKLRGGRLFDPEDENRMVSQVLALDGGQLADFEKLTQEYLADVRSLAKRSASPTSVVDLRVELVDIEE